MAGTESSDNRFTLGGGIELVGFRGTDSGSMVIIKKMVGSYARKFSDENKDFESLVLERFGEKGIKAAIMIAGNKKESQAEERNIFMSIDKALKEL